MNRLGNFIKKILMLVRRSKFRNELDEEMAFHREQAEKQMIAEGMPPGAAHTAAARQFGNVASLRETSHDVIAFRMETVVQDLRFALRQLRKKPSFTMTVMLILALGIGASVAIFGFVDSALLQPLPYTNPNRLMDVAESTAVHLRSNLSYLNFRDWQRLNRSFASLDAYTGDGFLLHTASGIEPVPAGRVTAGFFQTLGVRPTLGRAFSPDEDLPGARKVAILSYGAWMNRFGGSQSVIGQSVTLDSDTYTIVGVLPREFAFAPRGPSEFWVPIGDPNPCEKRRTCHNLFAVGRLRDGVSEAVARDDLRAIAAQLERMYPENKGEGASVQPLSEEIVGDVRPILLTLLAGSALLLAIACVNVCSLVLVKSESRRREMAVRGALGATYLRLMRQFVTEGMLLAILGCTAGIGVALWLMRLLVHLIPKAMIDRVPFVALVGLNRHTFLFTVCIVALTTLLMATTPMMRLGFQRINDGLSEGGRGAAGSLWRRLGANLAVVEMAIAVVLLVGAGLLGRSFYKLLHVDLGFDTSHLAMMTVQIPPGAAAPDDKAATAKRLTEYRAIEGTLLALPGVASVGLTSDPPVQCLCDTDWIRIVGKPFNGEHNEVDERDVSPAYLSTLKARLVRGRYFTEDEDSTKPQVIVINEALARKYFPGEDPIGKKIADGGLTPKSMREVIGVVADIREGALDEEMWPSEYFSINQQPDTGFLVMVRAANDEKALLPTLVSAIHKLDPSLGVYGEVTMNDAIESTQAALLHRFSTWLVSGFAAIALVLSVVGLYGVIAYSVSQRTREIGVRMALGAQRATVYRMVMRQAGWLTVMGIAIGMACAVGTSMLMRKLLFGVAAWDTTTLAGVAGVLGAASLAASFLPARRAALVNPTEALRAE